MSMRHPGASSVASAHRLRAMAAVALVALAVGAVVVGARALGRHTSTGTADAVQAWTLRPNVPLSNGELEHAAKVIRDRLSAVGISAEVRVQADVLTLTLPPNRFSRATLEQITSRGDVQVRQVMRSGETSTSPDARHIPQARPFPTASAALKAWSSQADCPAAPPGTDNPVPHGQFIIACDPTATQRFILANSGLASNDLASAIAEVTADGSFVIVTVARRSVLHADALVARVKLQPAVPRCDASFGCNEIALVVDGVVLDHPAIEGVPPRQMLQFMIPPASAPARAVAAIVTTGPLMTGFTIESDRGGRTG